MRAEQGHGENEGRQIIDRTKQQERGEHRTALGGNGLQHGRLEDAEAARRVAGDAENAGEGIERCESHEGEAVTFRMQDIERAGRRADIDDAEPHLSKGEKRAGQAELEENRLYLAAAHEGEIAEEKSKDAEAEDLIDRGIEMIDLADRGRFEKEADADDQAHAEPESDAGDQRQAGDLARRKARRAVDPIADRAARDERKAEREGNRIAGERGERGEPIGDLNLQMPQRERVIAGEREVA